MPTPERLVIETLFKIVDKERNAVPFKLNTAQQALDDALTGRDIVPKARQEGVSSYVLARFTAICLTRENAHCVVISHDIPTTQRMLAKVHYMLENIRGPKPTIRRASKNEIIFEKTGSAFYIGTAGRKIFGRGDTISHLHCSECAYWPNPEELLAGLFQAVPKSGEIILESTGNGVGNDYHKRVMRAYNGQSRFTCHFLPWHTFPEYSYDLTPEQADALMENLMPELGEPELVERFGLTAGQLAWRRDKLEEMDYDLSRFRQEYPMTIDECFQASGNSVFSVVHYEPTDRWRRVEPGLHVLEGHPDPYKTYVLGADVAAGVGSDYSCAQLVCLETFEQVAEFHSNNIAPDAFARRIASLSYRFNQCLAAVESNNHGLLTIHELKKLLPISRIFTAFKKPVPSLFDESAIGLGVATSNRSKPLLIGGLRRALVDGLVVHSPVLASELSSFVEHDSGKLAAQLGCHDDTVMALAMACSAIERASLAATAERIDTQRAPDPFCFDAIVRELSDRRVGLPISEGVL